MYDVGKLRSMLTDRCVDTGIKTVVVRIAVVPPQEYAGEVWERNKKVVQELEIGQMRAAQDSLGCSTRASSAAVQAEWSKYPPKTRKYVRTRSWQNQMGDLAPTTIERNVRCRSVARGNRPSEWARAVEQIWKGLNSPEDDILDVLCVQSIGGYK